jgi:hypothetical protein
VQPTLQEGLKYHHAESTYVMLVTWLSSSPSTIPRNASHQVGIGAFVVNDEHEVLLFLKANCSLWMLTESAFQFESLSLMDGHRSHF